MRELRLFRRRIMVRIAWAQALSLVSEESSLQQLSALAETLIVAARDWLYSACCNEWGTLPVPKGKRAAADPRDGETGRRRTQFLVGHRSDFARQNMAQPAAGAASWITDSSLPASASG